ncbi:hypothetical protein QQS21_010021 [Conoideocrella luteorostrata]|uniref:Uncharacterized protein n=1 Tax=Conoideocrella luteorostrata TaxID=1105319 RepID=A0AAJ0CFT8_9HYPO|nr:hypothetical protein QQS21_010021 [Conoideocrella luteorostrata]
MSPDTVSSLFPERPIRPLPKRRLRERMSPEVADSIKYPSSTHGTLPLFHYPPYTLKEEGTRPSADISDATQVSHVQDQTGVTSSQRNSTFSERGKAEATAIRSTQVTRSPPEILGPTIRQPVRPDRARQANPQPPLSATSSLDGYDSFETNNKKKRKIPSAGDLSVNGAHGLNSEASALAISTDPAAPIIEGSHGIERPYQAPVGYSSSTSYVANNQGFSGPGRGRLGRSRNGRSPLRTLHDGINTWPAMGTKLGAGQWSAGNEGGGIISSAIASAGKLPPQGQENVSLLQQHRSTPNASPASAQFTFTCDSQVSRTVQWPGQPSRHNMAVQAPELLSTMSSGNNSSLDMLSNVATGPPSSTRRKPRRHLAKELDTAARRRKQMAAERFHHNPLKLEDMWICEFCEYERIFGEPPRALIRDYEVKDRRQRQEEAERRRLLEKAKAKGRKSKKGSKASQKGGPVPHSQGSHGSADLIDGPGAPPMRHGHSHSTQSEEDYDDEPEDRYTNSPPERVHPPVHGDGNVERNRAKT